jgi:hypothetical protein
MDADLATPLYHIKDFYDAAVNGDNVIIGTRNIARHHPGLVRRLISNTGNLLFRLAVGLWIEDSQCGFKMFDKKSAKLCFGKMTIYGWSFDMEVLAIARANGLKIKAFRIDDWQDVPDGTFTEGVVKISARSLKDLVRISASMSLGRYR